MTFYYGKSADGSDMKEFEGMYVSPCGKYWSTEPFPPETFKDRIKRLKKRSHDI